MNFEALYLELIDSTNMISGLLAGITQEEASTKPNPESWSMLELLCHLYDEEREDFREHLDFILHRKQEQWHTIEPGAWVTARKYNVQNFREMKEKFFAERSKSLDWLKGLSSADWDTSITTEYGTVLAGEMFASWVAHDNLAIRQFVELRRARLERITAPYSIAYAGDW
jgi:DinB family protein